MVRVVCGRSRSVLNILPAVFCLIAGPAGALGQPKLIVAMIPPPGKMSDTLERRLQRSELLESVQCGLDALTTASLRLEDVADLSIGNQVTSEVADNKPLTREAVRMWMQSYNAWPYALLRYKGDVPYRETQNYAPRSFRYYQTDLSNSEYEPHIQAAAKKWGMDP